MSSQPGSAPSKAWSPPGGWVIWAGCAGIPAAYLLMFKGSKRADEATTFDSFLRAHVPASANATAQKTDFNSFLRVKPSAPCSTDFGSFLRDRGAATPAQDVKQINKQAEEVPADSAPVLVMFGTEYGFSKEIAEKLCQQLKDSGKYWPTLVNMADVPEGYDFSRDQVVLMCCSTQGDGVPPTEARDFCDWFCSDKPGPLSHLHYSVLALGDSSYTHFCRCGKSLATAWAAAGGRQLTPRRDVDKEDWAAVDGWIAAVVQELGALQLKTVADMGGVVSSAAAPATSSKRYSKSKPYYARVVAIDPLCQVSSKADKETIRVELQLGDSGLSYLPGDALGIYPTNNSKAVSELLAVLGATGDEAVQVPSWHYTEDPDHTPVAVTAAAGSLPEGSITLRHALTSCYDLHTPKAEPLLQLLLSIQQEAAAAAAKNAIPTANGTANCTVGHYEVVATAAGSQAAAAAVDVQVVDEQQKKGVAGAAATAAEGNVRQIQQLLKDKQGLEAYLAERHVVDICKECGGAGLSVQQLLPVLRPLQPRLYSISSTPLEAPYGVQVSVAVVRYESLGVEREGVCSTHLAERLQVGSYVPVYISKNPDFRLPADPSTPVIMVGPGTGLAPFRSFILHRILEQQQQRKKQQGQQKGEEQQEQGAGEASRAAGRLGPMVLYFGCRRRDQDYLYGSLLEEWAAQGAITLHTAFSREGPKKVYVQDLLAQSGAQVWQLLQAGGHFYVCGDANSMAGAVEQTLLDVIHEGLGGTKEEAQTYLDDMAAGGRYERDVWFS